MKKNMLLILNPKVLAEKITQSKLCPRKRNTVNDNNNTTNLLWTHM